MKIVILTAGSRGDVQPYVALGRGLRAAGHTVTLATMEAFAPLAAEHGLQFAAVRGEYLELLQTPEGADAVAGRANPLTLLNQVAPMLRRVMDDALAAAEGAEAIIYHPKILAGHSLAERLGVPGVLALPTPLYSPTRAFPSPLVPLPSLGPLLNRLSHRLMVGLAGASVRGLLNRWRRERLGLPPVRDELTLHGRPVLRLYGYSPAVLPTPPDWDRYSVATGYWFLDQGRAWEPPAALRAFLDDGPAPVYVGFGSMPTKDAARTTRVVLTALEDAGQRGVLATGLGGLATARMPDSVFLLEGAPHDWLFPQMAAVVHHGGAGTTAEGLRAGVPAVVCPFFGDQPFWGRRVAELGAGPRPLPQRRLSARALSAEIRTAVGSPSVRARSAALGSVIRGEDGVGRAVAAFEEYVGAGAVPAR